MREGGAEEVAALRKEEGIGRGFEVEAEELKFGDLLGVLERVRPTCSCLRVRPWRLVRGR